jgi:acylpyruvate hydrolase
MKIICIGRNYAAHAEELKNEVPGEPVIFMKPDTAVPQKKMPFFIPEFSAAVHYEVELVLRINRNGKHIDERFARKYFDEITVGIDFTARDVQDGLKKKGLPWELAKAFDGSAPVGDFVPLDALPDPGHIRTVQEGDSALMLFPFEKIVAFVSRYVTLKEGDLLFTGTPAGVGPVAAEDTLEAWLEDRKLLTVRVK